MMAILLIEKNKHVNYQFDVHFVSSSQTIIVTSSHIVLSHCIVLKFFILIPIYPYKIDPIKLEVQTL